jgi:hypothetical protein
MSVDNYSGVNKDSFLDHLICLDTWHNVIQNCQVKVVCMVDWGDYI